MSRVRFPGWPAVLGAVGWLALLSTAAAATLSPTAPDAFFVYAEQEETGDAGLVTNVVWAVGTNWFRLAPVPDWRVRANAAERRLEVLETDGSAALLLRFQRVLETEPEPDLRSAVLRRHSGFRVLREFDVGSGCGPARVLDLVLTREGEGVSPSTAVRRVAVVPTGHGYLECALSTSWRWLEGLDPLFARFLVSVRPMAPPRT